MNKAFEDILHTKTLITCPIQNEYPPKKKSAQIPTINVAQNVQTSDESRFLNTSDSNQSIILENIDTNRLKINKLQDLLNKIEEQKLLLTQEIEKEKSLAVESQKDTLKLTQKSISEKEAIKYKEKEIELEKEKVSLKKRERKLREKEIILERKLREIQTKPKDQIIANEEKNIFSFGKQKDLPLKIVIEVENEDKVKISHGSETSRNVIQSTNPKELSEPIFVKPTNVKTKPPIKIICPKPIPKVKHQHRDELTFESTSTTYKSPPEEIHTTFGEILKQKSKANILKKNNEKLTNQPMEKINSKPPQLNLEYYINKLLQMSRSSIDNLPESNVSDVTTPNESIINNPTNMSLEIPAVDAEHIKRLRNMINESQSFVSDIDKSTSTSSTEQESILEIQRILEKSRMKKKNQEMVQIKKSNLNQSNLKGKIQPATSSTPQVSNYDAELMKKYNLLTENCSKRIDELSDLIKKVRNEKRQLIDTHSFSSSGGPVHSTEYLDLPNTGGTATDQLESNRVFDVAKPLQSTDRTSQRTGRVSQIAENRNLAASCDSGIGASRPVTSSDVHGSPDIRPPSGQLNFEPIIKDTLKPIPTINVVDEVVTRDVEKKRPPVSIRFNPQMEENPPHELSTIIEVDTPATSKLNTSNLTHFRKSSPEKLQYQKFLGFSDYAKHLDVTAKSISDTDQGSGLLKDALQVSDIQNLEYQGFVSKPPECSNFEDSEINKDLQKESDSQSSLPDVVAELKKRNVLDRSFQIGPESPTPLDDIIAGMEIQNISSANEQSPPKSISQPTKVIEKTTKKSKKSPIKSPSKNKLINQSSLSGITLLSSDSESTFKGLEKNLSKMGLDWATTMLKKNEQTKALSPSSTSSQTLDVDSKLHVSVTNSNYTDSSSINGRPLGLKEFLARELTKRCTTSDLSSSVSTGEPSSLASMFLKSLINSSSSASPNGNDERTIQRTSTPNAKTSSSQEVSQYRKHDGTSNLFSGESHISSVRMTSSDGEPLSVPMDKLNLNKNNKKT